MFERKKNNLKKQLVNRCILIARTTIPDDCKSNEISTGDQNKTILSILCLIGLKLKIWSFLWRVNTPHEGTTGVTLTTFFSSEVVTEWIRCMGTVSLREVQMVSFFNKLQKNRECIWWRSFMFDMNISLISCHCLAVQRAAETKSTDVKRKESIFKSES